MVYRQPTNIKFVIKLAMKLAIKKGAKSKNYQNTANVAEFNLPESTDFDPSLYLYPYS